MASGSEQSPVRWRGCHRLHTSRSARRSTDSCGDCLLVVGVTVVFDLGFLTEVNFLSAVSGVDLTEAVALSPKSRLSAPSAASSGERERVAILYVRRDGQSGKITSG